MGRGTKYIVICALAGVFAAGAFAAVDVLRSDGGVRQRASASNKVGTVKAAFKPDDTKLSDCTKKMYAFCLEQAFGNLAYTKGPRVAIAEFDKQIAADARVESGCHRIGHAIGGGALLHYKQDVGQAFANGSATCWSGYYHGILERAYFGVPKSQLSKKSAKLCTSREVRATQFLHYQCVHGIGHGLMIYTGYDLPASLKVCEGIPDDWESTSCDGGVFMENQSTSYGTRSQYLKKNDPIYPCNEVAKKHKLYCYLMVTSRINELNKFDWGKTAATCRTAEKDWVDECFQSYGRDASGQSRQQVPSIINICARATNYEVECIYGAVRDMASNYHGAAEASGLCEASRESLKARCYFGMGSIIGTLAAKRTERGAMCSQYTPAVFRPDCYKGAGA